jgi:hypothetical protein
MKDKQAQSVCYKKWYSKNKEVRHQYYLDNRDAYLKRNAEWRLNNKEHKKEYDKQYNLYKRHVKK